MTIFKERGSVKGRSKPRNETIIRTIAENVCRCLEHYGWNYRQVSETSWETGWSCEKRTYPMVIDICETWVTFEIRPLLQLDLDWQEWPELSSLLLELNHSIQFVKLSLSEEGEIMLSAQLFSRQLNDDSFHDTVGILGHYTEILFEKLLSHAMDLGAFGHTSQVLPA